MRILFVTANRVGDAVLSTGILAHLIAKHPTAQVTVVAGPSGASLFRTLPNLGQLIVMEKKRYGAHWLALWRHCVAQHWDIVVDLRRSLLAYCLPAVQRFVIPKAKREMHRVELIASTIGLKSMPPPPTLWHEKSSKITPEKIKRIAIAPAANWIGKQWSAKSFTELAVRLTASTGLFPDARVAIFAAEAERAQIQPLLESLPKERCEDFVGAGDLSDVASLLRLCDLLRFRDLLLRLLPPCCANHISSGVISIVPSSCLLLISAVISVKCCVVLSLTSGFIDIKS